VRPTPVAPPAVRPSGRGPSVNAAAFAGRGELAFVSRGVLWVLDGATGALRRVRAAGATPADPVFSRDGRWLAFLGMPAGHPGGSRPYTLWLAAGNGSGAHRVRGLAAEQLLGWSPARDVVAVTAGPSSARAPYGLATAVRLVSPSGSARVLVRARAIESAAWSPGGGSIAVAAAGASASMLASYPVPGGRKAAWLRRTAGGTAAWGASYLIDPAGWWPHRGIGFWALADSASLSADQVPFYVIGAPGARPRLLGYALSGGTTGAVAAAPGGWLALADEPPGSSGDGKSGRAAGSRPARPARQPAPRSPRRGRR
jgi:hypothetical protein